MQQWGTSDCFLHETETIEIIAGKSCYFWIFTKNFPWSRRIMFLFFGKDERIILYSYETYFILYNIVWFVGESHVWFQYRISAESAPRLLQNCSFKYHVQIHLRNVENICWLNLQKHSSFLFKPNHRKLSWFQLFSCIFRRGCCRISMQSQQ